MTIHQISVFLENRPGQLAEITSALSASQIGPAGHQYRPRSPTMGCFASSPISLNGRPPCCWKRASSSP